MDYFFSKFVRNVKRSVSIISGGSCVAIITLSLLGINTIAIPILAGVAIFPSGLIFFENTALIRKMEETLSKLDEEMINLELQVKLLETENKDLQDSINKLESLLGNAKQQVEELSQLAIKYKESNKELKESLSMTKENNEKLDNTVTDLFDIKEQYEKKIFELNSSMKEAKKNLEKITIIKLEQENRLNDLGQTTDNLNSEVTRLDKLVNQSKEVIATLLGAKDLLTDMKSNTNMMKTMIDMFGKDMTEEMFERLDADSDGNLTKEEFLNRLKNREN